MQAFYVTISVILFGWYVLIFYVNLFMFILMFPALWTWLLTQNTKFFLLEQSICFLKIKVMKAFHRKKGETIVYC